MIYTCNICGYEYDEKLEEVSWAELPDDYACPLCDVGKDDFSAN